VQFAWSIELREALRKAIGAGDAEQQTFRLGRHFTIFWTVKAEGLKYLFLLNYSECRCFISGRQRRTVYTNLIWSTVHPANFSRSVNIGMAGLMASLLVAKLRVRFSGGCR
jgi:hypothetical protein